MNIAKYARRIPLPVRNLIRNSLVGQLYQEIQRNIADSTKVSVTTPVGPMSMEVYEYWSQLDRIERGEEYEPVLMEELRQNLTSTDVFYNVGARWGIFSKYARQLGVPRNQIHSFEADEHNFKLLEENLSDYPQNLCSRVGSKDTPNAIRLDTYAEQNDKPTIVKIDVEGAEFKVLKGIISILETASPNLFIEIHPEYLEDRGDSQGELVELLSSMGYDLDICLDNRGLEYHWKDITVVNLPTKGDYLLRAFS